MQYQQLSHALIITLLSSAGLLSGAAHALSPTAPPTSSPYPTSTPQGDYFASWDSGRAYTSGQRVAHGGAIYEAKWWTQGDNPAQSGEWGAWKVISSLQTTSTPAPTPTITATPIGAWDASTAYTTGQRVNYNGHLFEAQWWTQGQAPNPADQWGPWKDLGAVGNNQPPKINRITPSNGQVLYGEIFLPVSLAADVSDTDGTIAKVEFILNGKSIGIDTSAPYGISATIGSSNTLQVIATDNLGASTSASTSFTFQPGTPPPPTPSPRPTIKPVLESAQITTWKNGAKGAYSLVHDDYCSMPYASDPYINIIDPELKKRGLVAGFGMITGSCSPQHWAAAKQFIANGHEIVSHSRNHPDPYVSDADLEVQLNGSAADIAANLEGYATTYFIWPSDAASTVGTTFLKNNTQYLGGRASHLVVDGSNASGTVDYTTMPAGVNAANFDNPYRVLWDLFTVDGQWSLYPMGSEILNLHIDAAISQGGWATRTAHSVDTGYWQTIPLARYQAHLDYAKAKIDAGELWMDTPSNVIKYRYARENCRLLVPAVMGNNVIGFSSSAACQKYATPLTLQITASNVQGKLAAIQNAQFINAKPGPQGSWLITVDPLAGNVTLVNAQQ